MHAARSHAHGAGICQTLRPSCYVCVHVYSLTALPAFDDNYIWMLTAPDGATIVVDPGDAGPVLRARSEGLSLSAILVTHHHADHVGGVVALQQSLGLPCYAPEDARIPGHTIIVAGGDTLHIDAWPEPVQVIDTPGHTRSHVSYVTADHLFCGDTLFSLGCGRLFEGDAPQLHASLQRLAALPSHTRVCCAHEYSAANARFAQTVDPTNQALHERAVAIEEARAQGLPSLPTSMGSELECNPFLRVECPEIRMAAERWRNESLDTPQAVLGALRAWKDGYR